MNIAIIGGGATGLLLLSQLAHKFPVTLYVRRNEQLQAIHKHHLTLHEENSYKQITDFHVAHIDELLPYFDYVFVCVKQTQLERLMPKLQSLHKDSKLIFLQNGMGHIEKINMLPHPMFVGVIEHGAKRANDHTVHFLGRGQIRIAALKRTTKLLESFVEQFSQKSFPFQAVSDWKLLLKQKLVVNAVINPLTALFNVENGKILTNDHIYHLAQQLCVEACKTLQLDFATEWERVCHTARNTANNTSSMRADLLANRQTEIDAISGYLLRQQKEDFLPYTSFVYKSILALEKERDRL